MAVSSGRPQISAAEQAYLLAIRKSRHGAPLSGAELARRMGVSPQATSEMVRRLAAADLVTVGSSRAVELTTRGNREADAVYRRHALAEWFLGTILGIGWAELYTEANSLQSAISPRVAEALDELLGHPQTCPHGNPIEDEVARQRPRGECLCDMDSGALVTIYRITEEAEEDAGLLSYLEARGLRPGVHVHVLARSESTDSLTLEGPLGRATLGLRPARLIHVLPGEAEASLFHRVPPRAS